ncbi:MAG: indolepyruvate oxidoreductase subunit IorB [Afipia sp.]|nr:MAG: indolepyruvate oxidoreductase subunit IorB [Afipia sp.]
MKIRVKVPPSPYRLLKERYFGEETRNPREARAALTRLSARLPADVVPIVSEAVHSLIDYQDPDYALAYLDRIGRYVGPVGVTVPNLPELAQLLSDRMHFEDPIRIAQLELMDVGGVNAEADGQSIDRIERFRWDEVIAMLPPKAAAPALDIFKRLRLARLTRRSVTLRFSARNRFSLRKLKWLAAARITRPFSERFKKERVWVERWLHMVDRSLVKQPEATVAIIRTANLIKGHGDAYQNGLAEWNVIIDRLVKPTCDGDLPLPKLGEAISEAREAAGGGQDQARLLDAVEQLRAQALAH